mgnify:CR=1 FL=1
MNDGNKFLRIFALFAFVAFAAVSCWSTTESLSLTLENAQIPKWVFWVVVIGLFVLTAYCSKLFIDTLTDTGYMENRKPKFYVTLLGIIVLWLLFSMPTNSHTFIYKQMAKQTALNELKHVDSELVQLTDTAAYISKYNSEWAQYDSEVKMALDQLKHEINDPNKLGFGPIAESKLAHIEDLFNLKTGTIDRHKTITGTQKERNQVCAYYDNVVKEQLDVKLNHHSNQLRTDIINFLPKINAVRPLRRDIEKEIQDLDNPNLDREAVLKQCRQVIDKGYATLESTFNGLYHPNDKIYHSERLTKVTKVWGDYLKGKFSNTNYTLWYWILLAVIVDIAAFAFYGIAFKKDDYDI